ncbi:MAG: efflux RND transporter periplasmic adaptor subunit [Zoogloeaceae bacterium]|jgi:macrolide-specific efflux system membrane fusion protein|nr:efflux RND transporter periplasmic adaptor subunit [Zoogloeaceae bacterium]
MSTKNRLSQFVARFLSPLFARVAPPVFGLLVVLVGGVLVLAVWSWSRNGGEAGEFIGVEVRRGNIEDLVTATGALQPRNYVDVGAQVSGQLEKIHVEVGQVVREGELLAEIDAEQSAAKVEASLAQLRALDAQLEQRRLSLVKAERDFARLRNLVAEEAATVESLQNAETEVAGMRAQMAQLRAQIEQLRATTRFEEANLKYAKIYAPMSGTVVSISAKQGQTLNANQSAPNLMRIADLAVMNVETQVSEADVGKLRVGMETYFTILGGQGRRWYGKLAKVEPTPTVTNNVVLYNALFEVPNERGALMTQMTAQVFFVVAQARDVLFVPMSALNQTSVAGRPEGQKGAQDAPRVRPARSEGKGEGGNAEPPSDRSRMNGEGRERRRGERRAAGDEAEKTEETGAARRREAVVKVMRPDGGIEERKVTIGVSNRIHAEVISGLAQGEMVVAGVREREGNAPAASNRQQPSQLQQPVPGMPGMPGGMGRSR